LFFPGVSIALDLLNPLEKVKDIAKSLSPEVLRHGKRLRGFAIINGLLVATTVASGAFVAGNDAGRAYNSFPKMGDEWIPTGILEMDPKWRNMFENTATVQFDHRVLAVSTLASIGAMYVSARRGNAGAFWAAIPKTSKIGFTATVHMAAVQVALGISTLLLYVPIPLAAVHQAGSLALLTCVTYLTHSLRFVSAVRTGTVGVGMGVGTAAAATAASTFATSSTSEVK
jgi:cytochrome c oxidase assembly protein subunit 15